jgi:hypothetical protein
MALIYANAKQVLVLDGELGQIDLEGQPRELIDARILCSKWNTRCWTLQEGVLARVCLFLFRNSGTAAAEQYRAISPKERDLSKLCRKYLQEVLAMGASKLARRNLGLADSAMYKPNRYGLLSRFIGTWNDIGQRSTTKAEDIHAILANLTDFSAAKIMSLESPVDRVKAMLERIGQFPLDLMYNDSFRPEAGGNHDCRWVPAAPGSQPLVWQPIVHYTNEGLMLRIDSWDKTVEMFLISACSIPTRFCFKIAKGPGHLWCWVECKLPVDDALPREDCQEVGVLCRPTPEDVGGMTPRSARGARLLILGITHTGIASQNVYSRYDCPLNIIFKSYPPSEEEQMSFPCLPARPLLGKVKVIIEQRKIVFTFTLFSA